jgi:CheY-like chemotaxis protein/HPt (histidine-containing phosphotransfer) domain-containing protein
VQAPATTVAEARAQGRLILVAEDDPTNQKVLLRQLELLGHAAEVAPDGVEALRLWREGGYALVVTDLHMPNLDGYGLVAAIRAEEPVGTRTPVLALTANALQGEAARARAAGIDAYLTKPMQLADLRDALAAWMPTDGATHVPVPAPRADTPAPVLDLDVLRSLVGDDPDTLRELLGDFAVAADKALVEFAVAGEEGDLERLGAVAHRLKSSSRAVGAMALGDLCAQLENVCTVRDHAAAVRVAAVLRPVAQDVLARVREARDQVGQAS